MAKKYLKWCVFKGKKVVSQHFTKHHAEQYQLRMNNPKLKVKKCPK